MNQLTSKVDTNRAKTTISTRSLNTISIINENFSSKNKNKLDGSGIFLMPNGFIFYGTLKDTKPHNGILLFNENSYYAGYFEGGFPHGKGELILK